MEQETQNQKLGFFKKIWYSIDKIEKYGEMSAQGFPRAISYLFQIIIILALIVAGTTLYQTRNAINKVAQFVKDEIPNFTYSDNVALRRSKSTANTFLFFIPIATAKLAVINVFPLPGLIEVCMIIR